MRARRPLLRPLLALIALLLAGPAAAACDLVWRDGPRGRDLPLRIDLPAGRGPVPAVLWSPGVGGGITNAQRWVDGWTAAGIAVIRLQHPGADAEVYAGPPSPLRNRRVRAAVSAEQMIARVGDIAFVVDELARRRSEPAPAGCDLARIDADRLGVAGHSAGSWAALWMAGQKSGATAPLIDRRFRAFILFSPSGPADPAAAAASFGEIGRPLLVVTGSRDGVPADASPQVAASELAERTAPYVGAPADGRKALLVVAGADHMVFAGDRSKVPAVVAMQDRSIRITSAWWRRWLADGEAAAPALARPPLAPGDRWERK